MKKGLKGISFVRASEESFRTVVLDALEGKRDACFLGEPTHRHPVLPRPARLRRPAVRRPAPTRPWYVLVLDSTGCNSFVRDSEETFKTIVFDALEGKRDGYLRCASSASCSVRVFL